MGAEVSVGNMHWRQPPKGEEQIKPMKNNGKASKRDRNIQAVPSQSNVSPDVAPELPHPSPPWAGWDGIWSSPRARQLQEAIHGDTELPRLPSQTHPTHLENLFTDFFSPFLPSLGSRRAGLVQRDYLEEFSL